MTKRFNDYGPPTDHPHDPRNESDDDDAWMGDEPGEPDGPELDEEIGPDDDGGEA
jgi:hypothetical protein